MENLSRADVLAWLDQSFDEAHESLHQLSEALEYLGTCWESEDLPDGRVPEKIERLLLAQQRRCQLACALIRRLERQVRHELTRVREPVPV